MQRAAAAALGSLMHALFDLLLCRGQPVAGWLAAGRTPAAHFWLVGGPLGVLQRISEQHQRPEAEPLIYYKGQGASQPEELTGGVAQVSVGPAEHRVGAVATRGPV